MFSSLTVIGLSSSWRSFSTGLRAASLPARPGRGAAGSGAAVGARARAAPASGRRQRGTMSNVFDSSYGLGERRAVVAEGLWVGRRIRSIRLCDFPLPQPTFLCPSCRKGQGRPATLHSKTFPRRTSIEAGHVGQHLDRRVQRHGGQVRRHLGLGIRGDAGVEDDVAFRAGGELPERLAQRNVVERGVGQRRQRRVVPVG